MLKDRKIKLKVCGMRDPDNIVRVSDTGPDYMGFIFYPKSPRSVVGHLSPEQVLGLPKGIKSVGVFVDAAMDEVRTTVAGYRLDHVQLHGRESPDYCNALKNEGISLIKAFGISENFDFGQLSPYVPYVDYFLFDTKGKNHGGNGYVFDWSVLDGYDNVRPVFLSGGLSLENILGVEHLGHIDIHAIDVNSRFEIRPGLKDVDKLLRLGRLMKGG